jgi:hypothetical protein
MRGLAIALLSVPAFAADYSSWPGREPAPIATEWRELAQQGDRCCKRRTKGQPRGNTCISTKNKCNGRGAHAED